MSATAASLPPPYAMFHAWRYQSASFFFLSASVTTSHRHPCEFDPVGAWIARSMHSVMTFGSTGFSRSSRLRTARVVVMTWSKSTAGLPHLGDDPFQVDRLRTRGVH